MKQKVPVEALTRKQNLRYIEPLREIARRNRKNATRTENILWYEALNKKRLGYKFTRQKPIGRFVVDFYCSELLLVIEVDGGYHNKKRDYDRERDKYLNILGINTIRINTKDILCNFDQVHIYLKAVIEQRVKILNDSPFFEGKRSETRGVLIPVKNNADVLGGDEK